MKPKITIRAVVDLDAYDIASDWTKQEAFDFVVALDEAMQEWDFTIMLADYFDGQRAKMMAEEAEEAVRLAAKEAAK
jgi:predicted membrane GTPase involved in stress response